MGIRRRRTIRRILFPAVIPKEPRPGDDHSSSPVITDRIQRPTRRLRTGRPTAPPYLVLLRAGFSLPFALRRTRCALTAPFHPYLPTRVDRRYIFCATFLQVALTGGYPAHCPLEFGLSSPSPPESGNAAVVWPSTADGGLFLSFGRLHQPSACLATSRPVPY